MEAKDNKHSVGAGLQQAIEYARELDVPYVYASNGDGFVEQNLITGEVKELKLEEFPSPEDLYRKYKIDKGIYEAEEKVILAPYYYIPDYKTPRYYQRVAINKTVDAVAKGQNRVLLVSATGTGKTYMTFQIIYRLWKSGLKKKILFLADRNVLIDQTMTGDFKPFGGKMTKVQNRNLDSSYEIYLALYQQLAGDDGEEAYRQFKPNFFDLIVIDECHRGSAKEESAWRKILDYFNEATHIGCTATPVETKEASSLTYFGAPVYEYSLKQGIDDGFLAPYKVVRIGLDRDLEGWRPYKGQVDIYGNEIEDREYNTTDYDRKLIIDERTQTVANRITKWLMANGRYSKTIVFCVDIDHAERMRQALINENKDLVAENPKYIMRITGDNQEGKAQLDYFIDVNEKYPTIVTTSKLMTTGVDCKTCKLIVLDNNIRSMTEFKQIIGRGTRLYPDYGKEYFTIMDFRDVCRLFADPNFDGNPVVITDGGDGGDDWNPIEPDTNDIPDETTNPGNPPPIDLPNGDEEQPKKYRVKGVSVRVLNERVQYYDKDGKLITESIKDYSKRNILEEYATLDEFIMAWNSADKKQAIIEELQERGVLLDALKEESATDLDDFDLILHIAYDKKPLTKSERVNHVKKQGYLYKYSDVCQQVLAALLDKYMNTGIYEIENTKVLGNAPFDKIGSPIKIAKLFGGKEAYMHAIKELERAIYEAA